MHSANATLRATTLETLGKLALCWALQACATDSGNPRLECPLFDDVRYDVTVRTVTYHCDDDFVLSDGDVFDPRDVACESDGLQRVCDVELTRSCEGDVTQDLTLSFNDEAGAFEGAIVVTKPGDNETCTETYDVSLTPLD